MVSCKWCSAPVKLVGERNCHDCNELLGHIMYRPLITARMLAALALKAVLKDVERESRNG